MTHDCLNVKGRLAEHTAHIALRKLIFPPFFAKGYPDLDNIDDSSCESAEMKMKREKAKKLSLCPKKES
jgi:hypothetical protein